MADDPFGTQADPTDNTNPLTGQPIPPADGSQPGADGSANYGTGGFGGQDDTSSTGSEPAGQGGDSDEENDTGDQPDTDPNNLPGTSGQGVV